MTDGVYRQDFIERIAGELDPRRLLAGSFAPYFDLRYERRRVVSARLPPRPEPSSRGATPNDSSPYRTEPAEQLEHRRHGTRQ